MRESKIETEIVQRAKAMKWDSYKFISPGRSGVPDRMFTRQGAVVVWLEIKAPGEKPNRLQMYEIQKLIDRGHRAGWVDNADDGIAFLTATLV